MLNMRVIGRGEELFLAGTPEQIDQAERERQFMADPPLRGHARPPCSRQSPRSGFPARFTAQQRRHGGWPGTLPERCVGMEAKFEEAKVTE